MVRTGFRIALLTAIKSHFRVINYIIIGKVECIARGAFGAALKIVRRATEWAANAAAKSGPWRTSLPYLLLLAIVILIYNYI